MWKDTREARLKRYQNCLKGCSQLYKPAETMRTEAFAADTEVIDINVCDYVLSPALHGYVLWVLREALTSGKKRLYFLARDGYFMYCAAKIICEKMNLPIECRYLSCSRYSIRIPMFHLNFEDAMEYICRGGIDVTMRKILNRAGLDEEEKEIVLYDLRYSSKIEYQMDDLIPYACMQEIRQALEKCESFCLYLDWHSKAAMPNLEGYLRQEGLLEDVSYALVDSGWVGSMQKVLNQLLIYIKNRQSRGQTEIFSQRGRLEGYYWGLYELPAGVIPEDYHCYYFSPGENLKEKVYFSNCLFEGIFSAPHGMTMGYELSEGKYRPVYAEISAEHKQFMEATKQRLMTYTEYLAEMIRHDAAGISGGSIEQSLANVLEESCSEKCAGFVKTLNCRNDKGTIQKLLRSFMGEPTRAEAELYGRLQFSDDVLDYGGHQIAAQLSDEELTANHAFHKMLSMIGVRKTYVKESAWYEGSAVRSGHKVRRHLRGYVGYKYLLYLRKKHLWRKIYG